MSTDSLRALAQAVKRRRLALQLARLRAANLAGMSKDTWRRVEEGKPVREMTYAAIEPVLHWAQGSCETVLAGGQPVPVEPSRVDPAVTVADVSEETRGEAARRIVESASIGYTELSASEVRKLSARIVEDLERAGII